MKLKTIILMLSYILFFSLTGCDDKDYSDDINALKKELEETKASIKTIQDLTSALQNQLFIDSYEKTDNGYILKMSDGSSITVTQGQKGENGADAPTVTSINEIKDALEFVFSDGSTITLPKGEKHDVITLNVEVTNIGKKELDFIIFSSSYLGKGPLYSFPENLEINWGDGRITSSCYHEYKTTGIYTVTIKAKKIHGLEMIDIDKVTNIDISRCSNIQYLDICHCKGDIKICNSPSLIEIDGSTSSQITKLDLENLPNLRYVEIDAMYGAESSLLEAINIINCPKIEILNLSGTKLISLDISKLTNLYELRCSNYISTIWVWEGFNPENFDNWSVPDGVQYKVK